MTQDDMRMNTADFVVSEYERVMYLADYDPEAVLEYGRLEHLIALATINRDKVNDFFSDEKNREIFLETAWQRHEDRKQDIDKVIIALSQVFGDKFLKNNYKDQAILNKADYISILAKLCPKNMTDLMSVSFKKNLAALEGLKWKEKRSAFAEKTSANLSDKKREMEEIIKRDIGAFSLYKDGVISDGFRKEVLLDMVMYNYSPGLLTKNTLRPYFLIRRSKLGPFEGLTREENRFTVSSVNTKKLFMGRDTLSDFDLAVMSAIEKTCLYVAFWKKACKDYFIDEQRQKNEETKSRLADGYYIPRNAQKDINAYKFIDNLARGMDKDAFKNELMWPIIYQRSMVSDFQGIAMVFVDENDANLALQKFLKVFKTDSNESDNYYKINRFMHLYRAMHENIVGRADNSFLEINGPVEVHISDVVSHWISEVGFQAHGKYKKDRSQVESRLNIKATQTPWMYDKIINDFFARSERARRRFFADSL